MFTALVSVALFSHCTAWFDVDQWRGREDEEQCGVIESELLISHPRIPPSPPGILHGSPSPLFQAATMGPPHGSGATKLQLGSWHKLEINQPSQDHLLPSRVLYSPSLSKLLSSAEKGKENYDESESEVLCSHPMIPW